MNIAFDMHYATTMSNQRGIGRFCHSMIEFIKKTAPDNSYFDFYPDFKDVHLEKQLKDFLNKNNINIFHMTSPFEANTCRLMKKEWFGSTKTVATLYDLIPLIFYDAYLQQESEIERHLKVLDFIRSCDIILAISETTKQDATAYAKIDPGKVQVILGGVDPRFKVCPPEKPPVKFGITKPYVIYTGGDDFRKNLPRTIRAFAIANRLLLSKYQLVIVGEIANRALLHSIAAKANLSKENFILTGYVNDNDLVKLYNSAELLLYPSLYEGLGLPVLEAMACGVCVLTSNLSSLDEISGDAAYKVNPASLEEIAQGLLTLLSQPNIRDSYRKKGLEHAKKFQWEKVAQRVLEAYNK